MKMVLKPTLKKFKTPSATWVEEEKMAAYLRLSYPLSSSAKIVYDMSVASALELINEFTEDMVLRGEYTLGYTVPEDACCSSENLELKLPGGATVSSVGVDEGSGTPEPLIFTVLDPYTIKVDGAEKGTYLTVEAVAEGVGHAGKLAFNQLLAYLHANRGECGDCFKSCSLFAKLLSKYGIGLASTGESVCFEEEGGCGCG